MVSLEIHLVVQLRVGVITLKRVILSQRPLFVASGNKQTFARKKNLYAARTKVDTIVV